VGTKFWKEFSFQGRKVETRFIWHPAPSTWIYASYAWREDQSEADLVPACGKPGAAELAPGKWHEIPAVADCRACHVNGGPPILGFNALQLSTLVLDDPTSPPLSTLSLHDALPICHPRDLSSARQGLGPTRRRAVHHQDAARCNLKSGTRDRGSEEHTSELQSLRHLVCRLLLEKKK